MGGSALRHKVDLAHYLLEKYDRNNQERGKAEAVEGGWKGGDEEHFIKMVKELSEGKSEHEESAATEIKLNEHMSTGKKVEIKLSLPPTNWRELQEALIESNLLPEPVPQSRVSRGYSGLPPNETPALEGAQRGQLYCPDTIPSVQRVMSSYLAFWNEPRGARDAESVHPNTAVWNTAHPHPFLPKPLPMLNKADMSDPLISKENRKIWAKMRGKYLTFEPDTGGWNNLRMSFENILIYAAVSGRALVLPPDQNIYLLDPKKGDKRKGRNYFDLFNLTEHTELLRRVPILTAKEFLEVEGGPDGLVPLNQYNETFQKHLWAITDECEDRKKSDVFCEDVYDHYWRHGLLADISAEPPNQDCVIFDTDVFEGKALKELDPTIRTRIDQFCNGRRKVFYNKTMADTPVWHFETLTTRYRLLVHFYAQNIFTDPIMDNFYKRFIRDFLRYHNDVMCAAAKIVLALQYEGYALDPKAGASMTLDKELVGGYSSLHVRRGDLQFKEVRLEAQEWYDNTKEIW